MVHKKNGYREGGCYLESRYILRSSWFIFIVTDEREEESRTETGDEFRLSCQKPFPQCQHAAVSTTPVVLSKALSTMPVSPLPLSSFFCSRKLYEGCYLVQEESRLCSGVGVTSLLIKGLAYCMRLPDRNVTPSWLCESTPCVQELCVFDVSYCVLKMISYYIDNYVKTINFAESVAQSFRLTQ